MSAISPNEFLDYHAAGAAGYVRVTLKRFSFQRRLWLVSRHVLMGLTSVIVMISLLGIVDFVWPLGRALRTVFLLLTLLTVLALLVYALLSLCKRRTLTYMAREIEHTARHKDNSLVTFAETLEHARKSESRAYMLTRLGAQARRNLESINVKVVAPRRGVTRSLGLMLLVLFLLAVLGVIAPGAFALEMRRIFLLERDLSMTRKLGPDGSAPTINNAITIDSIHVRVTPPAYSGLGTEEAIGDAPVRALAGSEIGVELAVSGVFADTTLGFGGEITQMRSLGNGRYQGSFVALSSGAFEARVIADQVASPWPIVRAVEVYTDVIPDARIINPTRDQLLRGVPAVPITIEWTAHDDLGLSNVVLKYIRSRGEADAAQFVDGVVPLTGVAHDSARDWRGGAKLDLNRLGLQAGDTLVYWIEARDRNPFANNTGRSASLAIAIMAPEPVKLNLGDLGPTEIGKFLLSERMIIIHTEKLHAERSRISKEEFLRRAQDIAAEQREFKNSFNEYMRIEGAGEATHDPDGNSSDSVDEKVQEAEEERTGVHMHGIPEPPSGSPSNVRDMVYAIRAMWDAENALSLGDTKKALLHEREALTRLKRAQLAVRYVPPVVARSKPIDLKRRYAGELNEIKTRLERLSRLPESKERTSLRAALAETYAAIGELQGTLDAAVTTRADAVARARERTRQAANSLAAVSGDHASTIAEALGQLRIVETELLRLDVSGAADAYSSRLSRPLSLLTKAASNLFAIADARTRANGGDASTEPPADDRRTSDYFRRLNK